MKRIFLFLGLSLIGFFAVANDVSYKTVESTLIIQKKSFDGIQDLTLPLKYKLLYTSDLKFCQIQIEDKNYECLQTNWPQLILLSGTIQDYKTVLALLAWTAPEAKELYLDWQNSLLDLDFVFPFHLIAKQVGLPAFRFYPHGSKAYSIGFKLKHIQLSAP